MCIFLVFGGGKVGGLVEVVWTLSGILAPPAKITGALTGGKSGWERCVTYGLLSDFKREREREGEKWRRKQRDEGTSEDF